MSYPSGIFSDRISSSLRLSFELPVFFSFLFFPFFSFLFFFLGRVTVAKRKEFARRKQEEEAAARNLRIEKAKLVVS